MGEGGGGRGGNKQKRHKQTLHPNVYIIIITIMKSASPLTKPLPVAQKSRQKEKKLLEIMF